MTPLAHDVPPDRACGTAQLLISHMPHWLLPMQTTLPGLEQDTEPPEQLPVDAAPDVPFDPLEPELPVEPVEPELPEEPLPPE